MVGAYEHTPEGAHELCSGVTQRIRHVQGPCTQTIGVFIENCEKPVRTLEIREGGRVF